MHGATAVYLRTAIHLLYFAYWTCLQHLAREAARRAGLSETADTYSSCWYTVYSRMSQSDNDQPRVCLILQCTVILRV